FKYFIEPVEPVAKGNITKVEPVEPIVVEPEKPVVGENKTAIEPKEPVNETVVKVEAKNPESVGLWRIYSNKIYYDAGGGSDYVGVPIEYRLDMFDDGTWDYGGVKGTWVIENIAEGDEQRWGARPYGSTRKIILVNWETFPVDGPMEEDEDSILFFWLIYHVDRTEFSEPGQVQLKFGRGFLG
ncbi:hypothetical protein HY570_00795, partial [Candidatus Micrarchaeota archaeon]|nr:hypothetical protein [Candidatus Micrarchaeota archaeon]